MSLLTAALLLMSTLPTQTEPAEAPVFPVYFVSPEGNDAWSGLWPAPKTETKDGPFLTVQHALEVLRAAEGENGLPNGATIYLRGGDYPTAQPIVLGAKDSGSDSRPVMLRSYKGETARFLGGARVPAFEPHEGKIVKAAVRDLLPQGYQPRTLYWNGKRQTLARWPNAGEGDLPGGGWAFVKAGDDASKRRFHYQGERPAKWAGQNGVEVSIWPNYNWWQTIAGVASIDPAKGTVELNQDVSYSIEAGRRLYYQNIQSELDAPGEWWYDSANGVLYFWPPEDDPKAEIILPTTESIFRIEGAHDINLWGFTLEMTTGEAVVIKNANACMLAHSTIRNTDGFGVIVSGGQGCRVLGNDIYGTGKGGIDLNGGDRKTLTFGNHQAVNNHIHDFGVLYQTYQTGVNVNGVGNTVAHNLIHDAPHIAILLTGNEHFIEYNEIHHVCLQGSDNGGFYMGRDWTQRGNKIRFNKFHDIYGFGLANLGPDKDGSYSYETPHQAWGIYLDDCSSGTTVFGNWLYRVPLCGVMIGGGRDNLVENNVFVDCVPALHIDDRWDAYPWDLMGERLKAMNPGQPPYSERYPELLKMGDDPRKPENNQFVRNVVYYQPDNFRGLTTTATSDSAAVLYDFDHFDPASTVVNENLIYHADQPLRVAWSEYGKETPGKILSWDEWQAKGFDVNSVVADPLFVDPDNDDYTLSPKSKAAALKFQPIPAHLMGLLEDEFRVSPIPPRDERKDGMEHKRFSVKLD